MKASQNHYSIHDVILSGAGPVGLFLACELALRNCSVLVLEAAESPNSPLKQLPFGLRGLSAPTIEALDRRGLLQQLEVHKHLKNPHKTNVTQGPHRQVGHFAGIPLHEGNIDAAKWLYRLPSSTEPSLMSSMQELETVLARRALALGVDIKRGLAVTGVQQTADAVTVRSGDQSFQAKWLVGCDGSRSIVRKTLGFDFSGTEPEFTGYSAQVDIPDADKLTPGRTPTPTGMYFQSQPGYLVLLEFDGGAGHRAEPLTVERFQETLRRVSNTSVTISTLHAGTTWTDRARQATTYRSGRVLLAGDAAHIHSPLGGQGLNLGLGDAMNLGWKLAATLQNQAPKGLLDSYQTERHPLGARVLDWSRAQVAIMRPDPAARALNAILRDLIETRDGATYMAARVWGIHTHYNLAGNHPLVGHSAPNFEFEDGTKIGDLMHSGQGILLDFENQPNLRTLTSQYGDQIKYIAGRAKEQFGLTAALLRPDGFIAWASDNQPDQQSLKHTADIWFVQNRESL